MAKSEELPPLPPCPAFPPTPLYLLLVYSSKICILTVISVIAPLICMLAIARPYTRVHVYSIIYGKTYVSVTAPSDPYASYSKTDVLLL